MLEPEDRGGEGWQIHQDAVGSVVVATSCRFSARKIADVGSTIGSAVAVENFFPVTAARYAHFVVVTHHGCHVSADEQRRRTLEAFSQVDKNAVSGVQAIDPFKTIFGKVELMKCRILVLKLYD